MNQTSAHRVEIIWKDDGSKTVLPFSSEQSARETAEWMRKHKDGVHSAKYIGAGA